MHPDDLRALAKEFVGKECPFDLQPELAAEFCQALEDSLVRFGKAILREERGRIIDDLERLVARLDTV